MTYLLLPGNPPAVYFYETWKRDILRALPNARIEVSPYPLASAVRNASVAMDQIFATHHQRLRTLHDEAGEPVTVIGHSLGGHFALRLLQAHPTLVAQAILIHPFLRIPSPRGRLILNTVRAIGPFKRKLIHSRAFLERFFPDLVHITNDELGNGIQIVGHEHATIGRDRSPLVIAPELRAKVRAFYCPGDSWCPPAVVAALKSQVATRECAEPHDFVTKAHYRQSMLEKIF